MIISSKSGRVFQAIFRCELSLSIFVRIIMKVETVQACKELDITRVGLDYVTIMNRILKLNFKFLIWIKVSDFNLNQFVLVFKSAVKIWAKFNIRNLVKNYPVLQVRSWICGGQGSWFVLKSSSLGQVSLLWKFEFN